MKVVDRFENALIKDSGFGWRLELEIVNGSGSIESTEGSSTSIIRAYAGTTSATYTFSYTKTTADISPILTGRVIGYNVSKNFSLTLRNSSGEIITT
jgi:hypothetical protein